MSPKPMLICAAVVLLVYGLIWMVIPAVGLGLYGHTAAVHDLASIIACYWGSAFIGIDVILWLARNGQADSIAVRAIEMGGLVLSVTGLVAGIIDALFGNPNAMILVTIMLYALFSVWFAVVALKKPV